MRSNLAFALVLAPHVLAVGFVVAFEGGFRAFGAGAGESALLLAQVCGALLPVVLRPLRPWPLVWTNVAAVVLEYLVALVAHEGCAPTSSMLDKCEDFTPLAFGTGLVVVPPASILIAGLLHVLARVGHRRVVAPLTQRVLSPWHYRALTIAVVLIGVAGAAEAVFLIIEAARPSDVSLQLAREGVYRGRWLVFVGAALVGAALGALAYAHRQLRRGAAFFAGEPGAPRPSPFRDRAETLAPAIHAARLASSRHLWVASAWMAVSLVLMVGVLVMR